jgi:hypothetical protein
MSRPYGNEGEEAVAVDPTREQGSDPMRHPVGEPDPEEVEPDASELDEELDVLEEEDPGPGP